eukprot:9778-Amphidinium_carterae.1
MSDALVSYLESELKLAAVHLSSEITRKDVSGLNEHLHMSRMEAEVYIENQKVEQRNACLCSTPWRKMSTLWGHILKNKNMGLCDVAQPRRYSELTVLPLAWVFEHIPCRMTLELIQVSV